MPFSFIGDLPGPGIQQGSPALQEDSLPAEPQGSPRILEWEAYSPANLPDPGIQQGSPALQEDSLQTELSGKLLLIISERNNNSYHLKD